MSTKPKSLAVRWIKAIVWSALLAISAALAVKGQSAAAKNIFAFGTGVFAFFGLVSVIVCFSNQEGLYKVFQETQDKIGHKSNKYTVACRIYTCIAIISIMVVYGWWGHMACWILVLFAEASIEGERRKFEESTTNATPEA